MGSPADVYRSLAYLNGAGVPWPQAIDGATGGQGAWRTVRDSLAAGRGVAASFEAVADALDVALLAAGEASGGLQATLAEIAEAHEAEARRRGERRTRAAYPIALAVLAALLLPLPDLLAPSADVPAALSWSALAILPLVLVLAALRRADRRMRPPAARDATPPRPLPVIGPLATRVEEADARALEALARLHDAGVPADEAARLASRAGWGGRAAVDLHAARARALAGDDLAGALRTLPPDLARRLAVAEQAGELAREARAAAAGLRARADARARRGAASLPALLLLLVGAVIAWRVISFWGAYYGRLVP